MMMASRVRHRSSESRAVAHACFYFRFNWFKSEFGGVVCVVCIMITAARRERQRSRESRAVADACDQISRMVIFHDLQLTFPTL